MIFVIGAAFLLMLLAIGERAGTRVWHGSPNRYLDVCTTCDVSYPRPAGHMRVICPHGHTISAVAVEPHTSSPGGLIFIALSAGFVAAGIVLAAAGFIPSW